VNSLQKMDELLKRGVNGWFRDENVTFYEVSYTPYKMYVYV
jgi:hypothetical protein